MRKLLSLLLTLTLSFGIMTPAVHAESQTSDDIDLPTA